MPIILGFSRGSTAYVFLLLFLAATGWGGLIAQAATPGWVVAWGTNNYGQTTVSGAAQGGVTAIAAGYNHAVALKSDGTVIAWGNDEYGKTRVPAGLGGVTAIAAGRDHSVALKSDGTVVAWGSNNAGQTEVPVGLGGVTAITAGLSHTAALKSDGTVVVWGSYSAGQAQVPVGLSGVTAIAAGALHTVALKSDGTVVVWGADSDASVKVPEQLAGVTAIAAGGSQTAALKGDGTVVAWGRTDSGRVTVPAGLGGVVAIAVGYDHMVALKGDGRVVAWGINKAGQTSVPTELEKVTAIAAGGSYTVALANYTVPAITAPPVDRVLKAGQVTVFDVGVTGFYLSYQWYKDGVKLPRATDPILHRGPVLPEDAGSYTVVVSNLAGSVTSAPPAMLTVFPATSGSVVGWGATNNGQVTVPPAAQTGVTAISAGGSHTVALKGDGTVVAWGNNEYGQAGIPPGLDRVGAIAAGVSHTVALKSDGTVEVWGRSDSGQTRRPAGLDRVAAIAAGALHTVALKSDGTVVLWGADFDASMKVPERLAGVTAITAGYYHTVALKSDGTVVAWGRNASGQTAVPAGLSGVTAVAAGESHTVALKSDGTVVAWGANTSGQTNVPAGLTGVVAIAAGASHTVALKSDGTVVAWGRNDLGRTTVPAGIGPVTAIAAGGSHTVALANPPSPIITVPPTNRTAQVGEVIGFSVKVAGFYPGYQWYKDGIKIVGATGAIFSLGRVRVEDAGRYTVVVSNAGGSVTSAPPAMLTVTPTTPGWVVAWGLKSSGRTAVPAGLGKVTAIAAGGSHTVALKSDGTVVAWGGDDYGQTTVPVGLNSVTAIAAGEFHTVALKSDGTVMAWGRNDYGQANVPAGLGGVAAIMAGYDYTVALKSDGTVVAWGWNSSGQTNVPAGLNGVTAIAAEGSHTVALKSDGTVVAWGWNAFGQTNVPAGLDGVTAIAAGGSHTAVLKSDGTVVAWGRNDFGQTKVPAGLAGVTAIAAGGLHTVALKSDGTVVAWGRNDFGETTVTAGLNGVTAIAAGDSHTVALALPLAPVITSAPLGQTTFARQSAPFTVNALGLEPLRYQWFKDGVSLPDATNASLNLTDLRTNQMGGYTVSVSNAAGGLTSAPPALLVVNRLYQNIFDLPGLPPVKPNDPPLTLAGEASSGLALSYSSADPAIARVSGNQLIPVSVGETLITAMQEGDDQFEPARPRAFRFTVVSGLHRLPAGYWPLMPFTVVVDYLPKPGTFNHTVTEQLPTTIARELVPSLTNTAGVPVAYWESGQTVALQPTDISDEGEFDPTSGKVKWGPFFDDRPRQLHYTLTPPAGWSNAITFSGVLSEDGKAQSLPNQSIALRALHPADNLAPTDHFITIGEMSAYTAVWKRGGGTNLWPVPPIQISDDGNYITQAALIWRKGEYYEYVGGAAPGCWQPAPRPPDVQLPTGEGNANSHHRPALAGLPVLAEAASGLAVRSCTNEVNPSAPFLVSIVVTPNASTITYLAEDQLPSGWSAKDFTQGGTLDTTLNKVKWGPFFGTASRTLTYTAVPPAGASGNFSLSGLAAFDGTVLAISGTAGVFLGSPQVVPPPAVAVTTLVDGSVIFSFGSESRLHYVLESSTDLHNWQPTGISLEGTGGALTFKRTANLQKEFFRVLVSVN